MKKTPEIERMHIINLHDCRKKVAEALSELEGMYIEYVYIRKNNMFLITYFKRKLKRIHW